MIGIDKSSPYREALTGLIYAIDQVIHLSEANMILLVYLLNTEKKIILFNEFIKSKMGGDHENDLRATEDEIVSAANRINREENARTK